jgi:hypothetical protein
MIIQGHPTPRICSSLNLKCILCRTHFTLIASIDPVVSSAAGKCAYLTGLTANVYFVRAPRPRKFRTFDTRGLALVLQNTSTATLLPTACECIM